ncbi:19016_t:CDS:2, partial [Gigaspora rosea]
MNKLDKFVLNARFCQPHTGINKFFSVTSLKWWNDIKKFTGFVYASDPTVTAQQVFSQYIQNLADITKIKNIESGVVQCVHSFNKMIIKTEYLKIIGDTLLEIIQKNAIKRKIKTGKTRNLFQSATEDDVENWKNAGYINNYTRRKKQSDLFLQKLEDEMDDEKCE